MSIETWPVGIQDKINESGFALQLADTVLRTQTEVGPKKIRRQYTTGVDVMSGSIRLNRADYATFVNFFKTTLNGGATSFYFDHPISEDTVVWRFTTAPSIRVLGGNEFIVSMSWEQIIE